MTCSQTTEHNYTSPLWCLGCESRLTKTLQGEVIRRLMIGLLGEPCGWFFVVRAILVHNCISVSYVIESHKRGVVKDIAT